MVVDCRQWTAGSGIVSASPVRLIRAQLRKGDAKSLIDS